MADLRRYNQNVWVCSIIDEIELTDENGNYTGIYKKVISNPIKYRLGVSASVGNATFSPFGADLQYSREICTSKKNIPINITNINNSPSKNGILTPTFFRFYFIIAIMFVQ